MKDSGRLFLVVLAAFVVRLFTLWVGRPEFNGWFNHTYYSFVQVRGLLERGVLPYRDMPLLFGLDALIARAGIAFGVEPDAAVVAATRLVMCLVPSLVALPVYGIIRRAVGQALIPRRHWVLVAAAAFLPLSVTHLPEMMQKNMLGLLLLAILLGLCQRLLERDSTRDRVLAALLVLLIAATHFGTLAATAFFGVALLAAHALVHRAPRRLLALAVPLAAGGALCLALVRIVDVQRFRRILEFAAGSVGNSLVGAPWNAERRLPDVLVSLAAILAAYGLLFLALLAWRRHGTDLPPGKRVFWLANILFCFLLLLPVLDERLMSRLVLFLGLPLIVVFLHTDLHVLRGRGLRRAAFGLAGAAIALLAVGEVVSSRIHDSRHAEVLADLRALRDSIPFGIDDLILARTGAEHVSNWFLGTRAGVITALHRDDFDRYRHVYVLQPIEGRPDFGGLAGATADGEIARYSLMRRDIPRPPRIEPLFRTDHLELFELDGPPPEWIFDESGRWHGYRASALPAPEPHGPREAEGDSAGRRD